MVNPVLKFKFYGTRGSIPICDSKFQKYGGNTTCIQIKSKDNTTLGIIDAGSGIRKLGKDIYKSKEVIPKEIFLGFTHFHWDHIQGFPFFDPAYDSNMKINIIALGENRGNLNLKQIFEGQMQSEYFPVPLEKMGAKFEFSFLDQSSEVFSNVATQAVRHNHPGGAYSYKFEQQGKSALISTDIEHGDKLDKNILSLAKNVDLLIHDAQYTSDELKTFKGWGHSSYDQAIELALKANVKRLVLTHHDPNHDDDFLDEMEKYCQKKFANCQLAKEGMEISI